MLYTVIYYLTENFQWRLWAVSQKQLKFYALCFYVYWKICHMLSKVFVFIAKFFSKMQASVFWAHYLLFVLENFSIGPMLFCSLHSSFNERRSRRDAFPSSSAAVLSSCPSLLLPWVLSSDHMLTPTDVHRVNPQGWGQCFCSCCLVLWLVLRWMDLWKIQFRLFCLCGQKVCKTPESSQPHALEFSSLS